MHELGVLNLAKRGILVDLSVQIVTKKPAVHNAMSIRGRASIYGYKKFTYTSELRYAMNSFIWDFLVLRTTAQATLL